MRGERGSVTAEFAIVFPAAIALLLLGLSVLGLQLQRVQLVTTASVAARAASHLMPYIDVKNLVEKMNPGSSLKIEENSEVVCAEVSKTLLIEVREKICTRMQGL